MAAAVFFCDYLSCISQACSNTTWMPSVSIIASSFEDALNYVESSYLPPIIGLLVLLWGRIWVGVGVLVGEFTVIPVQILELLLQLLNFLVAVL